MNDCGWDTCCRLLTNYRKKVVLSYAYNECNNLILEFQGFPIYLHIVESPPGADLRETIMDLNMDLLSQQSNWIQFVFHPIKNSIWAISVIWKSTHNKHKVTNSLSLWSRWSKGSTTLPNSHHRVDPEPWPESCVRFGTFRLITFTLSQ